MYSRIGIALLVLLSVPHAWAHDPFILDARRATPGPRLELIDLSPTTAAAGKRYRLQVGPGLARGLTFGVFTKPFDHAFHEVAAGFQVDESGKLVTREGGRRSLDELEFGPGPYPLGAVWEAALVSSDKSVRIFAKTVPHPIIASNGTCKVSLELASYLGDRFTASGTGFPPEEEVVTELRYSGRVFRKQNRVSSEGVLPPDPISHRAIGADRGARYSVTARSCQVSVEYDWGEPGLLRH